MRRSLLVVALLTMSLFLVLAASACSGAAETKEEYQAKVEQQLSKTDDRIKELEAKSENATGDEKSRLEQETAKLKDERQTVQGKLDQLRSAGGDDWKKVKGEIDGALSGMNEKVDKALEGLKN